MSIFNGKTFKSFDLSTFHSISNTSSIVNVIKEDKQGNIWIGTNNGLLKYDGSKFSHIADVAGLPAPVVNDILIDDSGLWV